VLAKLAIMEDSIQPPPSIIQPAFIDKTAEPPIKSKTFISIKMKEFLGCVSDKDNKNYMAIEASSIDITLKMEPGKTEAEVLQEIRTDSSSGPIQVSYYIVELNDLSIFFCNVKDNTIKRRILLPFKINLFYIQQYMKHDKDVYL
jgi:hypothetical protein